MDSDSRLLKIFQSLWWIIIENLAVSGICQMACTTHQCQGNESSFFHKCNNNILLYHQQPQCTASGQNQVTSPAIQTLSDVYRCWPKIQELPLSDRL